MKASEAQLLYFIRRSSQFVIPIYQRAYSWEEKECRQLWDDILRTGKSQIIKSHFVGSIVYIEEHLSQITSLSPMLVIDGQQRLTTITLLLAALSRKLEALPLENKEIIEGFSPNKIKNYYLINREESSEKRYKLLLSKTDKETLIAIVSQRELPKDYSIRVKKNYENYVKWIDSYSGSLEDIVMGIAKLAVVDISLSRDHDNPQLIFESMNSTGKELTQADLIRNYILMGLSIEEQSEIYENYWRPMETDFGQEAYTSMFDRFVRHFLTIKTGNIPKIKEVYEAFKDYIEVSKSKRRSVRSVISDLRRFSKYYCKIALGKEDNKLLKETFNNIVDLRVDVAYPMLLELYSDYDQEIINVHELNQILQILESYIFRRAICSIPTNSLNKTFVCVNLKVYHRGCGQKLGLKSHKEDVRVFI